MDRDTALQLAIQDVSGQLGVSVADLTGQIETLGQQTTQQQQESEQRLRGEIQNVADLLGKPARAVTQADIDYVNNLLARGPTGLTPEELWYDYNQDGKIDANDQAALTAVMAGQQVAPAAPGSIWAPTGLYEQIELANQAAAGRAAQAQIAADQRAMVAKKQQQQNTLFNLLSQTPDAGGQRVDVKTPEAAKIGYAYDWSSIFANPQQEKMFMTPYAKGGRVKTLADEINEIFGR